MSTVGFNLILLFHFHNICIINIYLNFNFNIHVLTHLGLGWPGGIGMRHESVLLLDVSGSILSTVNLGELI